MANSSAPVALMTVSAPHGAPSLAEAAAQLGVAPSDMDEVFGVVPVDPDRGMYAVQVQTAKLPSQSGAPKGTFRGPWSSPSIEPFGPPSHGDPKDKTRS